MHTIVIISALITYFMEHFHEDLLQKSLNFKPLYDPLYYIILTDHIALYQSNIKGGHRMNTSSSILHLDDEGKKSSEYDCNRIVKGIDGFNITINNLLE